jgi:hypothetical protein
MEPLEPESFVSVVVSVGNYTNSSCGLNASMPIAIIGSGSGTTVVSCGGEDRFLVTSSSVALKGLTVRDAIVLDVIQRVSPTAGAPLVGGSAVEVVWPPDLPGSAVFSDVAFLSNSVSITLDGDVYDTLFAGGALLVSGGSSGARVVLDNCTFAQNGLAMDMEAADDVNCGTFAGGAVYISLFGTSNVSVALTNVTLTESSVPFACQTDGDGYGGGALYVNMGSDATLADATLILSGVSVSDSYGGEGMHVFTT